MNKLLLVIIVSLIVTNTLLYQVKIGSAGVLNANAVLELDGGTSKGMLLPNFTNTEIVTLTATPDELVVYNKTDIFLYIRKAVSGQKIRNNNNINS